LSLPSENDIERWLENRQGEIDGAAQYDAMAAGEAWANVADVYRRLAAIEEKHAAFWEQPSSRYRSRDRSSTAEPPRADARVDRPTPPGIDYPPHGRRKRVRTTQRLPVSPRDARYVR
jgi:hypothetical protein